MLLGLGSLACPLAMGLMMWIMIRGLRSGSDTTCTGAAAGGADQSAQVDALRAEIEQLKIDRAARAVSGGR